MSVVGTNLADLSSRHSGHFYALPSRVRSINARTAFSLRSAGIFLCGRTFQAR